MSTNKQPEADSDRFDAELERALGQLELPEPPFDLVPHVMRDIERIGPFSVGRYEVAASVGMVLLSSVALWEIGVARLASWAAASAAVLEAGLSAGAHFGKSQPSVVAICALALCLVAAQVIRKPVRAPA